MQVKIGDVVARKSYQLDLLFRVIDVKTTDTGKQLAILYGDEVRLIADANCIDLIVVDEEEKSNRKLKEQEIIDQSTFLFRQDYQLLREKQEYYATSSYSHNEEFFHIPGRVLHIDGDPHYLQKCLSLYEKIGVPVNGVHISENEMPDKLKKA